MKAENIPTHARRILSGFLAAALAWCVWCALRGACARWTEVAVPEDVTGWRAAARSVPADAAVSVLAPDAALDSIARYRLIAVDWEVCPRVARLVARPPSDGSCVVASAFLTEGEEAAFAAAGYAPVASNAFAAVWAPADAARAPVRSVPLSEAACGAGGLRPPNGLGVYAGKAKLLLACGGLPAGFWTDPAYAVYQPSYPPGMTLAAALVFRLAGVSDRGLVSLVVPAALAGIFFLLAGRGGGFRRGLAAALYVSCPLALRMGSGFYAEPCAALCLVGGAALMARGRPALGWWVVGGAALFRHEALLLAGLLWCAERLRGGRDVASAGQAVRALLPGVAWQILAASCGARIYDFDFAQLPDWSRAAQAAGASLRILTLGCGEVGGGALLAALCAGGAARRVRAGAVFAFLAAGALLLGFSVSPHFGWMLANTLPRTVWLATALVLAPAPADRLAPGARLLV